MKRSRRTPSRRTKRAMNDIFAAQPVSAPKDGSARDEDQFRERMDFYVPSSLKTGAGRQYWDEVLRLLVRIRTDCDAAAERLGYPLSKDDGLAAVEYIANKILEAVRGERQQPISKAKGEPVTRGPESPDQAFANKKTSDNPKGRIERDSHSERSKWIDELKQTLRDRKTQSGAVITPQLAHEIAKQITVLNEGMARPETTESVRLINASMTAFFAKIHGRRSKPSKASAAKEKPNRAKSAPSRAKKSVSKGAKRRSR